MIGIGQRVFGGMKDVGVEDIAIEDARGIGRPRAQAPA
jgi:hypothetical protein